jgi:hypothetical protein
MCSVGQGSDLEKPDGTVLSQYGVAWLAQGRARPVEHVSESPRTGELGANPGRPAGENKGVGDAMTQSLVDRIAAAVLYEGYILYPYRPSVKNQQRWTFGGLYPQSYCRTQKGSEAPSNQTECLVEGTAETSLEVRVRFLHLTARTVGAFHPPLESWPSGAEPAFRPMESLQIEEEVYHAWQEAEERQVELSIAGLASTMNGFQGKTFAIPCRRSLEPLQERSGRIAGVLVREQQPIAGAIEVSAVAVADRLFRVKVCVINQTQPRGVESGDRDAALLCSLVSAHTILTVHEGAFVSLLDPPESWRDEAAACRNIGTWPVLVGETGARDTLLSSPIILYDYPQVAAESPGDLFDGTEIDEILTLRILTLTEEEKRTAAALDGRVQTLLARTEALACEQLSQLHGTVRPVPSLPGERA